MIIFKGHGYLGLLIPIVIALIVELIAKQIFGENAIQKMGWIAGFGFFLSAAVLFEVGKRLNRNSKKRLIDPATNTEIIFNNSHTIFFIPLQYFSGVVAVLGLIMMFSK